MRHFLLCCLLIFVTTSAAWAVQSTPIDSKKQTNDPSNAVSAPPPPTTSKTAAPNPNRPAPAANKDSKETEGKTNKESSTTGNKPANSNIVGEPFPRDVAVRFLESCTGLNKQMLDPCKCMLNQFQKDMSLDDFVTMANASTPEKDPRFLKAAGTCIKSNQQQ